jgi:peptide/nickel transport system ATP-binding protein
MGERLLDITGLKTYIHARAGSVRAVDDVSLCINAGETVGLVGESGCGKTMTAHSIMRLIPSPPAAFEGGKISFQGRDLLALSEDEMRALRGRRIAMVFQDPMTFLNPVLRIGAQIAEAAAEDTKESEIITLLQSVGIPYPERVVKQYPHELSGGMRQRVLIAIAIVNNPALLIADEPTTALDVTVQTQILSLLKSIRDQKGTALLLITHDLGIVAEMCDRVYVMYAGKIVETADVFGLFEDPLHPYTQGLLKSALSIAEFSPTLTTIEGSVPDLSNPPAGCRFHPRCPQVMDLCKEKEPPLDELKPGHLASCWLYKSHE